MKHYEIVFPLLLWVVGASAQTVAQGSEPPRVFEVPGAATGDIDKRADMAAAAERRRGAAFVFPAAADFSEPGSARVASSTEGVRRSGRLSPEERRTLRRQINEAGADLYLRRSE